MVKVTAPGRWATYALLALMVLSLTALLGYKKSIGTSRRRVLQDLSLSSTEALQSLSCAKVRLDSARNDTFFSCPQDILVLRGRPQSRVDQQGFHAYTNRGLREHLQILPSWFDLEEALTLSRPDFTLLEIGVGYGRTLLEVQSSYPSALCLGTNYDDYGDRLSRSSKMHFVQAESQEDLYAVAVAAGIEVMCVRKPSTEKQVVPIMPVVKLLPSFDRPGFRLTDYFADATLDWVLSIHTLNNKLRPDASHLYLPSIVDALACGGTAVIHVGSLGTGMYSMLRGIDMCVLWHSGEDIRGVSGFMYIRGQKLVVMFRRHRRAADRAAFEQPFLRVAASEEQRRHIYDGVTALKANFTSFSDSQMILPWMNLMVRLPEWSQWA